MRAAAPVEAVGEGPDERLGAAVDDLGADAQAGLAGADLVAGGDAEGGLAGEVAAQLEGGEAIALQHAGMAIIDGVARQEAGHLRHVRHRVRAAQGGEVDEHPARGGEVVRVVEGLDDRHDAVVGEAKIADRAEREEALDEVLRAFDAADLGAAALAGEAELLAR